MKFKKILALLSIPLLLIPHNTAQANSLPEYNFNFTGNQQEWTVPLSGKYKIESWGAQGDSNGGKGGYVSGEIELNKGDKLTIQVGGQNGYNGGGSGSASGGGASDVRLNGTDINKRILSAAGGGGGNGGTDGGNDTGKGGTSVGAGAGSDGVNGGGGGRSYNYSYESGYWNSVWVPPSTGCSWWQWDSSVQDYVCKNYVSSDGYYRNEWVSTGYSTNQGNPGKGGSNYLSTDLTNTSSKNGIRTGDGVVKITQLVIPPSLDVQISEMNWTKEDVTLTITAKAETNPVKGIRLPNGVVVNQSTASYVVSSNGNYQVSAIDTQDYVRTETVVINKIDKEKPTANVSYDGTKPDEALTIQVQASDIGSGVNRIVLPNKDEVKGNVATYRVTNPGTYTFEVYDNVGNKNLIDATVEAPEFSLTESGGQLVVQMNKRYSGEGMIQRTDTGEIFTGSQVVYPIPQNGVYTFRVNDGGIWSEQKFYRVENYHELQAPRINVSFDSEKWHKGAFPVTITATSNTTAKIEHIILPNGVKIAGSQATFVISENGLYTFYAVDERGQVGYHSIHVKRISNTVPEIELDVPTDWSNSNQEIKINVRPKEK